MNFSIIYCFFFIFLPPFCIIDNASIGQLLVIHVYISSCTKKYILARCFGKLFFGRISMHVLGFSFLAFQLNELTN